MTELSPEDEQLVEQFLNTLDTETINLIALDRKYGEDWYEEQLRNLEEMDKFFYEVGEVMEVCGKHNISSAVKERRKDIARLSTVYENALEDIRQNDHPQQLR